MFHCMYFLQLLFVCFNRLIAEDMNTHQLRKSDNRGGRDNASSRPLCPTALWSQGSHQSQLQTILYGCKYILGL